MSQKVQQSQLLEIDNITHSLHSFTHRSKQLPDTFFDAHQGKAFSVCREKVFDNKALQQLWSPLFPLDETQSDQAMELSHGLVSEFFTQAIYESTLLICSSQLKDLP